MIEGMDRPYTATDCLSDYEAGIAKAAAQMPSLDPAIEAWFRACEEIIRKQLPPEQHGFRLKLR